MAQRKDVLLSADAIADAGIALIESGEPFGINAIARRLGVRPSSLYNHVDGLDALVELMRGRLVDGYRVAAVGQPWAEFVTDLLRSQRRMYADHVALAPLLFGKSITSQAVIASYDDLATTLVRAGLPDPDVVTVIGIVDAYAIGFGLDLASPESIWVTEGETRDLERVVAAAQAGAQRADTTFDVALEMLLAGLRARYPQLD